MKKTETTGKTATIVGVLYITGTIAGILSVVFTGPVLNAPDYLVKISAHENRLITGALFLLVMGLALAMIPVLMFPVSKKYNEVLALGYVVFRGALETITYIGMALGWLLLLTLSKAYVQAGAPDVSGFTAVGSFLSDSKMIASVTTVVFILGALMFYSLLYQSRLVPRWISGWGLIAAVPYLAAGLLVIFSVIGHMSAADTLLRMPLGLQEMVLAVWLIVKGFNSPAMSGVPVKSDH